MKKITEQHGELIEEIGLVIEERADLTPLAARIYATLILTSAEGLSFQDITETHQASKSAVSNNLNVLIKLKYAEYYTKPGKRKRYFKASKFYAKTAMEKYDALFEKEIKIVEKINDFNKKHNPEKFKSEHSSGMLYQDYLNHLRKGFLEKIKQVHTFEAQH